jgi:hypothetical protein
MTQDKNERAGRWVKFTAFVLGALLLFAGLLAIVLSGG